MPEKFERKGAEGPEDERLVESESGFADNTKESMEELRKIDNPIMRAYALEGAIDSSSFLLSNNPYELIKGLWSDEEYKGNLNGTVDEGWLNWREQTLEEKLAYVFREQIGSYVEANRKHQGEGKGDFFDMTTYPKWFRDMYDKILGEIEKEK